MKWRTLSSRTILSVLGLVLFAISFDKQAAAANPAQEVDLTSLSIEQLLDLEVSTLSRKTQRILEAAAAVSVITQEDIRRSGATTIPETLRMVPGMNVARINESTWAVSARGLNALFVNEMLVLVDGRSVYTPLFSGVYWDELDIPLEDVERIEVIRGPGGTLWGANAVNGIINIITKNAKDSQGGLLSSGGGTKERYFGTFRYGGMIGENTAYRVTSKYNNRDNFETFSGDNANDAWENVHSGIRLDSAPTDHDRLMFQANAFYGEQGTTITVPQLLAPFSEDIASTRFSTGANVIGRWEHTLSESSDIQLQVYYDRVDRDDIVLDHHRDTGDIDIQHRFSPLENNEVVYGFEYRFYRDDIRDTETIAFDPDSRNFDLVTWFVQDEIALFDRRLRLIFGSKFEHNDFTGFEFQPNARVLVIPTEQSAMWAAVSRALKTPSRSANDLVLNLATVPTEIGLPGSVVLFGSEDVESEELIAYEVGYRIQATDALSIELAAFYNDYNDTESFEPGQPTPMFGAIPHLIIPLVYDNKLSGHTYGGELSVDWQALENWRLVGYYAFLQLDFDADEDSGDTLGEAQEDQSPEHQFMLRSLLSLPGNLEFDGALRYVSEIPDFRIDSYVELDLRLAWKADENLELSIVGQNLLDSSHEEFVANYVNLQPVAINRGVYGKLVWTF